jgi:hypothetical protein
MNPKEKAIDMVMALDKILNTNGVYNIGLKKIKKCAILQVNEILKAHPEPWYMDPSQKWQEKFLIHPESQGWCSAERYYEDVEREINKL